LVWFGRPGRKGASFWQLTGKESGGLTRKRAWLTKTRNEKEKYI